MFTKGGKNKAWDTCYFFRQGMLLCNALLISIGKLKPTIGMITYRNTCTLDSKGKIAYKLILKLLPVIFLGKCSSNSNYFGF